MAISHTSSPGARALARPAAAAGISMYLAAGIVQLCGFLAIGLAVGDPSFLMVHFAVTTVGTIVSFLRRAAAAEGSLWDLLVMSAVCAAFLAVLAVAQDAPLILPDSALGDATRGMGVMLCWMVSLRSFTLTSSGALLFACVPTTAMIGLSGTQTVDPTLRTIFLVFIAATLFMLIQGQTAAGGSADQQRRSSAGAGLLASQAQLTALYTLLAVIAATAISIPLSSLGPAITVPASLSNLSQTTRAAPRTSSGGAGAPPQVRVASGPVTLGDQIIMRVQATEPANWRSATYDAYDGHGWSNTATERTRLEAGAAGPNGRRYRVPDAVASAIGPRRRVTQTMTFEGLGQFTELYAAAEPREVEIDHPRLRLDASMAFRISYLDRVRTYRVVSAVPDASPEALRRVSGAIPTHITGVYTRLDDVERSMRDRFRETALDAIRNADTPYDRAEALRAWVAQTCKYNTAATAAPANEDVVDAFLYRSHQGYCDSFATALAVLCRSVGIPARVATGYQSGDLDPAAHAYLVRDRHRHMWTEVYLPTAGWIAFDATDGAEDITPRRAETGSRRRQSVLALLFRKGWLPPFGLLCLVAMIGYIVKVELWDRVRPRRPQATQGPMLPASNRAVLAHYERACAALGRRGWPRASTDTPHEYRTRIVPVLVAGPVEGAAIALEQLTQAVEAFGYSPVQASPADVAAAETAARTLRTAARSLRRKRAQAARGAAPDGA